MSKTKSFDMDSYIEHITKGPCFICEMLAGNPEYPHHIIYQDALAIVFLKKFPVLYDYTLVAPIEHREQVIGDFTAAKYLELQNLIFRVTEAIRQWCQQNVSIYYPLAASKVTAMCTGMLHLYRQAYLSLNNNLKLYM